MPRKRTKHVNLPERVYPHGKGWRWVPRTGGKPVWLGSDWKAALQRIAELERADSSEESDLVPAVLSEYMQAVRAGRLPGNRINAPRTVKDKAEHVVWLSAAFQRVRFADLTPKDVGLYLDKRAAQGAPVRANREKATLSHAFTWAKRVGRIPEGKQNPCEGVTRNVEKPRERYVTDDEYRSVYDAAHPSVRAWMDLLYISLQRPSDALSWTAANVRRLDDGRRALKIKQAKTGVDLDILVSDELEALLARQGAIGQVVVLHRPLIYNRAGRGYTESGIASMMRKSCVKVGVRDFGPRDIRGKGATDMYQAGVRLERIQQLLGHDSITTTEIYIKARLPSIVEPNRRRIGQKAN
jgi:integrase